MASSEYTQCLAYLQQGAALVVAVFMTWFGARNEGEWLKEKDKYGYTPLYKALESNAPEAVVIALLAAWPDAAKAKRRRGCNPLCLALEHNAPEAVAMALLAAWPDGVKERGNGGHTPLQLALRYKSTEAVAMALFEAWPGAVKVTDTDGYTPLIYALENKATEAVAMALFEAWPDAAKVKNIYDGNTPLHFALKCNAPETVAMALFEAWPDAVKEKTKRGYTPLHLAVKYYASDVVVRALIATFPGALKEVTKITLDLSTNQLTGGDTVLHMLATAVGSSVAESRNANTICFTLVEKRASLTATNALGQTPAEASQADKVPDRYGYRMVEREVNHHLIASLRETTEYKKRTHLSLEHFRDWTTVSHAWCTPSAKLVALTVLMVGETYKRGLLPRLPMDCWYFILNCIPRHELRQGGCEPAEEQVARAEYLAILREARARINAAAAAAAAAAGRA